MGLLTDPGVEKSKVPALLHKYHQPLVVFLYLSGVTWMLGLAHNALNHGTYFSENALLPGLVQGEFMGDSDIRNYLEALTEEAERYPGGVPYAWLTSQFIQLGLDTSTHNFTLSYPLASNKTFSGRNVYAILRAVRGASTESFVVAAPYRPPSSLHTGTTASIALMLALAKFFSEQVYWAKDIIFLITEHEQLGVQAWLEAYHRTHCGNRALDYGDLPARAGPIQAAVNLEFGSSWVSHIDVRVEGLNGQLPNLDLVNLVHRLCHRENVQHTFKNKEDHPWPETFNGWLYQLKTLGSMVLTQATGIPNGNHGLFHRFGIAAVTLEGVKEEMKAKRSSSLLQVGRILEGICRSLNNLLERFHQSFFFYILPATNRYISIGVYMPPFGLLGSSLLVIALALWYSTNCSAAEQDKEALDCKANGVSNVQLMQKTDYSLMGAVPFMVAMHAVCIALNISPTFVATAGAQMKLSAEDSIAISFSAFSVTLLLIPSFMRRFFQVYHNRWEVLKCLLCLELATIVFAGAVYNFSLALIVTAIYAPVMLVLKPPVSRLTRCFCSITLLLSHPLVLLYIFVLVDTYLVFSDADLLVILTKSVIATKRSLMYAIVDSFIYGNWVFDAACLCLLPVWLGMWYVAHFSVEQTPAKKKSE